MSKKRIILFANTDWYLYNFRLPLALKLREEGWDVVLVSPMGKYVPRLQQAGFRWIPFGFSTRSTNPVRELYVLFRLFRLYRREKPDFVHHFTIKCVLYGSLVARFCPGIKIVNAVPGLGYVFTSNSIGARLLKPLVKTFYRLALKQKEMRVIFQNCSDLDSFVRAKLVSPEVTRLIRGSGVNCETFCPAGQEDKAPPSATVRILFATRMLKEKGVYELLDALRSLKSKGLEFVATFAGDIYPGNPASLTPEDVESLKSEGLVQYLGHVDTMPALLQSTDIVVLPTYYGEGTPRILIEAAAMAKPIVATDIAGCRGLVVDQVNGFLVPVKDAEALAAALEKLIRDPALRQRFGQAGREIVLREFDEKIVLEKTFAVYRELDLTT